MTVVTREDLAEFDSAILTGITVSIGSQVLIFDNGSTVLIQCPFGTELNGEEHWGHGETVGTSVLLFEFLNLRVQHASLSAEGVLVLDFENLRALNIVPEQNGLESYVLSTRHGICPVVL